MAVCKIPPRVPVSGAVIGAVLGAVLTAASVRAQAAAPETAAIDRGRQTFLRVGCWECHGTEGQGTSAGRRLAPDPLPLAALTPFVRAATGAMPSYSPTILSDAEIADIRVYLASRRAPRAPDELPALRP
jgi:mono/diheme cytochrome c family protein